MQIRGSFLTMAIFMTAFAADFFKSANSKRKG